MKERLKYKYVEMVNDCIALSDTAKKLRRQIDNLAETDGHIIDLITEYESRGGTMPMTSESITKAFRPDKVKIGTLPNIDFVKKWATDASKAMRNAASADAFATRVQIALYKALPLDDVLTDYEGSIRKQGDRVRFSGFINLVCGSVFRTDKLYTISKMALEISQHIMSKHLYRWKAFAADIAYIPGPYGYLEVIYGVGEKT